MIGLLCYTNPIKRFEEENETLIKIHIDNSLDLGQELLLFTNFPYEYNGLRSIILPDNLDVSWDRTSNKILVIEYLLKEGLLEKELYWYHDFDAYENTKIEEDELGMENYDLGLTGYGYKDQINGGSFFFHETSGELFSYWSKRFQEINKPRTRADEKTMTDITHNGEMDKFNWKIFNITYNFGQRCPQLCYPQAEKPLKVLHFHPYYKFYPKDDFNINVFMHGKNRWKLPMMSERLIRIFQYHGIQ